MPEKTRHESSFGRSYAIAGAGLTMQGIARFGFSVLPGNPRLAHVLGVAGKS
jgi:hypothetical protein